MTDRHGQPIVVGDRYVVAAAAASVKNGNVALNVGQRTLWVPESALTHIDRLLEPVDDTPRADFLDHFLGIDWDRWGVATSGTGSVWTPGYAQSALARAEHPGILRLATGGTALGAVCFYGKHSNQIVLDAPAGKGWSMEVLLRADNLEGQSSFLFGLTDLTSAIGSPSNGIYAQVDRADEESSWKLFGVVDGEVGQSGSATPLPNDTIVRARVEVSDGDIRLFVDGVEIANVPEDAVPTAVSVHPTLRHKASGPDIWGNVDVDYVRWWR